MIIINCELKQTSFLGEKPKRGARVEGKLIHITP